MRSIKHLKINHLKCKRIFDEVKILPKVKQFLKVLSICFYIIFLFDNSCFAGGEIDSALSKQLIIKIISIPSVSGQEKELGEFLIKKTQDMGFYTHVFSQTDSSYNFAASLYPLSLNKPNLLFINHIDVVGTEDSSLWSYPPFSAAIIKDTIWGRGAIDMKGIAAMQLMATYGMLKEARNKDLPYNVTVLFMSGEESGGAKGAEIITERHLNELNAVTVFGEGGVGLRNVLPAKPDQLLFFISTAEKKSLWIRLSLKMKSQGHAAIPSKKNVNKIMFKAISRFEQRKSEIEFGKEAKIAFRKVGELNGGFQGFILKHINWIVIRPFRRTILEQTPMLLSMVTNTAQLTSIQNPYCPPNKIACQVAAYYDCRLLPTSSRKNFLNNVIFQILNPKIKIDVIDESPGAEPSEPNNYYQLMEKAIHENYSGSEVIPILFPASSDNNYFRRKGIPTFGIMPIELNEELLNTVHGINERLPMINYLKGIDTYTTFLHLLMENGFKK